MTRDRRGDDSDEHFLNDSFYSLFVKYILFYSIESRVLTTWQESHVQAVEVGLLRPMKGCIKRDRIRNAGIRF